MDEQRVRKLRKAIERCEHRIEEVGRSLEAGALPGPYLLAQAKAQLEEHKRAAEEELATLLGDSG